MGTRRASSSPARTELVNAVRTRDTAAAASGVGGAQIRETLREAPGRRGRPLRRIQVRDDGGKAGPRAHGDRGDLVAVEDGHEPQLERAVEIRVAEGSLYRLFALRGSGHVRLAEMALALRALHRVHHVRDLLHGAHDAGGGSRSGRASHHVVDEVADGIARGGSYARDGPRHAADHGAHRATDRAQGVAEDAAEPAYENRNEVDSLLCSCRAKVRDLVRLPSDLVPHFIGELLDEAAGRTGAGLLTDGAHDAADEPADTRGASHGLLRRPRFPIAVR